VARLERQLTTRDLVLMNAAAILVLSWISFAASAGPASLLLWVAAALLFFVPQALCVTALSSAFPEEGGLYVWTGKAFGPFHGFLSGWLYWINNVFYYPTIALVTAGYGLYVLGTRFAYLEKSQTYGMVASLLLIGIAVAASVAGWRAGKWVQNIGGAANWLPVVFLFVIAFLGFARFGSATPLHADALLPAVSGAGTVLIFSKLCFAFAGFELGPIVAAEIVEPRKTLPRAIFLSALLIAAVYIFGTLALLVAVPTAEISMLTGVNQAITKAGTRVGLSAAGPPIALLMTLGGLGGLTAWFAGAGRILFVAGLDRYLPPAFSRIHPRWKTPATALLVQGSVAAVLAVLATMGTTVQRAYLFFIDLTLILYFIPYLYMFASGIALGPEVRRTPGAVPVPGGRTGNLAVNLVGFLVTALAIVLSCIPQASEPHKLFRVLSLLGVALFFVGLGFGLYALAARRQPLDGLDQRGRVESIRDHR